MKQSKQDKEMDALIASTFHRVCPGVRVNILDIPMIFKAARETIKSGGDKNELEFVIKDLVERIRYTNEGEEHA